MKRCLVGASCLTFAVQIAGCSADAQVERRSTLQHGADLFETSEEGGYGCKTCHPIEPDPARTRIFPGAALAGVASRTTFWGGTRADLLDAVNDCRGFFMGAPAPWTAEDEDARAMFSYLTSLPSTLTSPQPFTIVSTAEDLPRGDSNLGHELFDAACAPCHGEATTGHDKLRGSIPTLPGEAVAGFQGALGLGDRDVRLAFIERVRHGPFLGLSGTMPPFSREALPDEDLASILSFLGLYR